MRLRSVPGFAAHKSSESKYLSVWQRDPIQTHSGYQLVCFEQRQGVAWAYGYRRTPVSEVLSSRRLALRFGGESAQDSQRVCE
jgi:hypothetical protein